MRASPGWFGAEPGFDAPPVSGCFGADLRSIWTVSASAFVGRFGSAVPALERAGSPPLPAGAFARPGPAGPDGAALLAPGALEAADPEGGGGFWPPLGWVAGRPAWGCAEAGAFG
ncbi:hypothetical protein [Nocardia niwae]|uniref:hypothetical protein n=1 Tax=Nocardia niwae TaxID=626084 RepID=UPI000AA4E4DE|nr:hypothetical protein [Nocardia niwae]